MRLLTFPLETKHGIFNGRKSRQIVQLQKLLDELLPLPVKIRASDVLDGNSYDNTVDRG